MTKLCSFIKIINLSCGFINLFYKFALYLRVNTSVSVSVVGSIPTGMPLCTNTPGMGLLTETLHLPL